EIGIDLLPGSQDFSDQVDQAVDAARSSFETAFTSLFTTGPFTGASVQAPTSTETGSSRDIAVTGALQYAWAPESSLRPYVTFGGGLLTTTGGESSVSIAGNYRLSILNQVPIQDQVPIQETDRATVRLDHHPAFTAVVGGGVRKSMSERWGLSFDARAWIGGSTTDVLIDAAPVL